MQKYIEELYSIKLDLIRNCDLSDPRVQRIFQRIDAWIAAANEQMYETLRLALTMPELM